MAKYKVEKDRIIIADEEFVKANFPDDWELVEEDKPTPNPMKDLAQKDNWSQQDRDDALRLILEKLG